MSDVWPALRAATPARIGLGNAGAGLPTRAHLDFQLAHARARDAVAHPLDADRVLAELRTLHPDVMPVRTQAADRHMYLANPGSGARLAEASAMHLQWSGGCDVVFVCADGLSARAIELHAKPLLERVVPALAETGWSVGPLVLATGARVALGDDIGDRLHAGIAVMLIGERPGLSSPDSLGIYLTWAPRVGRTNAERNCISNIRPEGLGYDDAAQKLLWLLNEARRRGVTGVALKDDSRR